MSCLFFLYFCVFLLLFLFFVYPKRKHKTLYCPAFFCFEILELFPENRSDIVFPAFKHKSRIFPADGFIPRYVAGPAATDIRIFSMMFFHFRIFNFRHVFIYAERFRNLKFFVEKIRRRPAAVFIFPFGADLGELFSGHLERICAAVPRGQYRFVDVRTVHVEPVV